jgi:hypothetical protein
MKLRWETWNNYKCGFLNGICCASVIREGGAYRYHLFNRVQPVSEGTEQEAMETAERALRHWMTESLKELEK